MHGSSLCPFVAIEITTYKKKADVAQKHVRASTEIRNPQLTKYQSFPFITETGTARPKGISRTLIQSHARSKPDKKTKTSSQVPFIRPRAGSSDKREENEQRRWLVADQLQLSLIPRSAVVNPFQTLPVLDAGNAQFYIHYCEGPSGLITCCSLPAPPIYLTFIH